MNLFDDIPGEPETFLMRGGSTIIAPSADCLTGPIYDKPALISAEITPQQAIDGRLTLDVMGHYSRPDIFELHVKADARKNVVWEA